MNTFSGWRTVDDADTVDTSAIEAVEHQELASRTLEGLFDYYRLLADTEDRSRVVESDGIVAAIVPATPHDAMFNSVVYRTMPDPCELERLSALYGGHGVLRWGVWLAEGDGALREALGMSGFTQIKQWTGMGMLLLDDRLPMLPADCEVLRANVHDFARVNDGARETGKDYSRAFARWSERPDLSLWALRCAGRVVSTLLEIDCGEDCSINSVATVPDRWGKGMAGALIQSVLVDARRRGYTTTTLQASPGAESLYRRLGYRPACAWTVWESPCGHPIDRGDGRQSYSSKASLEMSN
jgi:GNAT superfamily N-acetyltransferase